MHVKKVLKIRKREHGQQLKKLCFDSHAHRITHHNNASNQFRNQDIGANLFPVIPWNTSWRFSSQVTHI